MRSCRVAHNRLAAICASANVERLSLADNVYEGNECDGVVRVAAAACEMEDEATGDEEEAAAAAAAAAAAEEG